MGAFQNVIGAVPVIARANPPEGSMAARITVGFTPTVFAKSQSLSLNQLAMTQIQSMLIDNTNNTVPINIVAGAVNQVITVNAGEGIICPVTSGQGNFFLSVSQATAPIADIDINLILYNYPQPSTSWNTVPQNVNIMNAVIPVAGNVNANITNATLGITGTVSANITNASVPINGNVSANITNASVPINGNVSANITNASVPVTGNVSANITNASIPVSGNVSANVNNAQINTKSVLIQTQTKAVQAVPKITQVNQYYNGSLTTPVLAFNYNIKRVTFQITAFGSNTNPVSAANAGGVNLISASAGQTVFLPSSLAYVDAIYAASSYGTQGAVLTEFVLLGYDLNTASPIGFVTGVFGQSLSVGAGGYAAVMGAAGFGLESTWEFYFQSNGTYGSLRTILAATGTIAGSNLSLNIFPGANYFNINSTYVRGPNFSGVTNVCDNAWHHIALVSDVSGLYLFVDGVLDGSQLGVQNAITQSSALYVLGYGASNTAINAHMDELSIWSFAKYMGPFSPPISPYNGNELGLWSLYHFDGTYLDSGPGVFL